MMMMMCETTNSFSFINSIFLVLLLCLLLLRLLLRSPARILGVTVLLRFWGMRQFSHRTGSHIPASGKRESCNGSSLLRSTSFRIATCSLRMSESSKRYSSTAYLYPSSLTTTIPSRTGKGGEGEGEGLATSAGPARASRVMRRKLVFTRRPALNRNRKPSEVSRHVYRWGGKSTSTEACL